MIDKLLQRIDLTNSIVLRGKYEQFSTTDVGFSAINEMLENMYVLVMSLPPLVREHVAFELRQIMQGSERLLVMMCDEWATVLGDDKEEQSRKVSI